MIMIPGMNNNLYSVLTMRSPKELRLDRDTQKRTLNSDPSSTSYDSHNYLNYLKSEDCIINKTSVDSTVDVVDLENLASTLRTIIPPPDKFEASFRNPCWYMHLHLPLKVNKVLQNSRGNLSDTEASNLMNLLFGSSQKRGGASKLSSSSLPMPKSLVCIPQVYFIGFPRSGSTQLYKMLVSHPDLAGGTNKEPHWWTRYLFSSHFPHNILAIIRYLSHFREASEQTVNHTQQLLIDGSQSTVWDLRTTNNLCALPHLITSIVPNANFIVLMRNPVDRLFSDFRYLCEEAQRIKLKRKTLNEREQILAENEPSFNVSADVFHKVVQEEIESFHSCLDSGNTLDICTHLSTITMSRKSQPAAVISSECSRVRLGISLYHVHLKRWLKVIPRERVLFLKTEDMSQDPYALLERVWQFLDVEKQNRNELSQILYQHSHSSLMGHGNSTIREDIKMHQKTRDLLVNFLHPHNTALSQLLEEEGFSWSNY